MKLTNLFEEVLRESVKLNIMKNMEPAEYYGSTFGQDVEPAGTYVLEKDFEHDINIPNWYTGVALLENPLYIEVNDDNLVQYKYELAKKYKAKGKQLTKKLMSLGYDSIITKNKNGSTGEIILFPNSKYMLNK